MTHQMPDTPINMEEGSEQEKDAHWRFLRSRADYILGFRQPPPNQVNTAIIPLAFNVHTPDYVREALAYFHANQAQADLFIAVYKAEYLVFREGIPIRHRLAPLYLFQATQPAPAQVQL